VQKDGTLIVVLKDQIAPNAKIYIYGSGSAAKALYAWFVKQVSLLINTTL